MPGNLRQRARHFMHATPHEPNAVLLHVGYKHQRRWRAQWGRTTVSRVASEQLLQARIAKVPAQLGPKASPRPRRPECPDVAEAYATRQLDRRRALRIDERPLQGAIDVAAARAEAAVTVGFRGTGKRSDRIGRTVDVGMEVEATAVAPGMAGEDARGHQVEQILKPHSGVAKQSVENPAHREDRWSAVDARVAHHDPTHLAARCRRSLKQRDRCATPGEIDGCGQAAHPGSDNDDTSTHAALRLWPCTPPSAASASAMT